MADSGPRDRRLQGSAEDPAEPRSRFREAIDRYGYPVALASVAVLYLIWPSGWRPIENGMPEPMTSSSSPYWRFSPGRSPNARRPCSTCLAQSPPPSNAGSGPTVNPAARAAPVKPEAPSRSRDFTPTRLCNMIETRFEPADPSAKRVCANIEIHRAKGKRLAGDAVEVEERQATTRAATHAGAGGPSRILIACMPKSGSTFLSDLISALPDFKRAKFSASPSDGRQHELDEASLKAAGRGNFVGQVHVLYNTWTAKMCKDYRLKPVVLVRSLPDVIVSQRDHIRREGGVGPLFRADPNLTATDDATVEEMIVRFQASWYVNFYMSWRDAPGTLMISYEELTADPRRILAQNSRFCRRASTSAPSPRRSQRSRKGAKAASTSASPGAERSCGPRRSATWRGCSI